MCVLLLTKKLIPLLYLYNVLRALLVYVLYKKEEKELIEDLEKGRITAILNIQKSTDTLSALEYKFQKLWGC